MNRLALRQAGRAVGAISATGRIATVSFSTHPIGAIELSNIAKSHQCALTLANGALWMALGPYDVVVDGIGADENLVS